jgi:hypothetical protein
MDEHTKKISRTDSITIPSKAPHPTPCKTREDINCRYDCVMCIFHTVADSIKRVPPKFKARFPIAGLKVALPRLTIAATMKGTPVRAAAAIYETLYCVAMMLFVVTNNVFKIPAAAVDRTKDRKATSFFQAGQFCSSQHLPVHMQ